MHRHGPDLLRAAVLLLTLLVPSLAEGQAPVRSGPGGAIHPGDVVRLEVWRDPEYSGEFTIDEDGIVVLPRLGPLSVLDESPESLERRLVELYSEYVGHQSIDVTLLRRIQVLGAVRSPGLYPVDATMTISDALALAGGATAQGSSERVELIRNGERIAVQMTGNTLIANAPIRSGDQIYVPERSWISRNPGLAAAGLTTTVTLLLALLGL